MTQKAAHGRPEQEAHAYRGPQQAKATRALAWRADVGNVGLRRTDIAGRGASHDARDVQHDEAGRRPKQQVADDLAGYADEQHGSSAVAVRERAQDRNREKLGHRKQGEQQAHVEGARAERTGIERPDGKDQADAQQVEEHREEDERHGARQPQTRRYGGTCRLLAHLISEPTGRYLELVESGAGRGVRPAPFGQPDEALPLADVPEAHRQTVPSASTPCYRESNVPHSSQHRQVCAVCSQLGSNREQCVCARDQQPRADGGPRWLTVWPLWRWPVSGA